MMEDDIDEGAQDTGYVNLLSNCWRAIKESRSVKKLDIRFEYTDGNSHFNNAVISSPTSLW